MPSDIDSAISGTLTTLSAAGASGYRQALDSSKRTIEPGPGLGQREIRSLPLQTGSGGL